MFLAAAGCQTTPIVEDEQFVSIQIQDRNGLTETISAPERLAAFAATDFFAAQPYKKVVRLYKHLGKTDIKISTYHPNGQIAQYLEGTDMRAYGAYREWHPNGQQKIEAFVIGGSADLSAGAAHDWLFDGISSVWDDAGQLVASIPYAKGVLAGESRYYYSSGALHKALPYDKNLLEGDAVEYYEQGSLRSKTAYSQGLQEGLTLGFWEEGSPAWIAEYERGLLKKGVYYNRSGEIIGEVEGGRGFQALAVENGTMCLVEIQRGIPEGAVQLFDEEGGFISTHFIKNGQKNGEEEIYYPHQIQKKVSIPWQNGLIHGTARSWYPSGQLESEREWVKNKKSGASYAWYPDGSLMLLEEYEDDRLVKGQYFKKKGGELVSQVVRGNGIATLFDADGAMVKKVFYHKGKPAEHEE
jgi:antitoxin component YwqK of YwqJK toxin-antitoxin module